MAFTPEQVRVARIIASQARAQGIKDPAALVAAAAEESSLNPAAHGDVNLGGTGSWGLFQLYTGGGMGTGVPVAKLTNPSYNAGVVARAWAAKGGRTAAGPKAILGYFQNVGRGADNQAAYRRALPYYEEARRVLAQPGAAGAGPAAQAPAPSVSPVAAQAPTLPSLDPRSLAAVQRYLATSGQQVLAGQMPAELPPLRFTQAAPPATAPALPASDMRPAGGPAPGQPGAAAYGGVLGERGKIIGTPYAGTHTLGNWESDDAVDIAVPVGTPVYAPKAGTIGSQFGSLGQGGRFAGLRLHLKIPGNELYYAHLSRFAPGIRPGVHVQAGQLLGYTGQANGVAHLHLATERGDPRKVLGLA